MLVDRVIARTERLGDLDVDDPVDTSVRSPAMTYDHSRKAGNRGDVWKHSVLMALADVMDGNDGRFRYVECHAGAPIHDLSENREWRRGVGTISKTTEGEWPYAAMATDWLARNRYPAGWVFVAEGLPEVEWVCEAEK